MVWIQQLVIAYSIDSRGGAWLAMMHDDKNSEKNNVITAGEGWW